MPQFSADIVVPGGQSDPAAFRLVLRVNNTSDRPGTILNPDMGRPDPSLKWPYSTDAYRASLLMSFHFLHLTLEDDSGAEVPQNLFSTWSTPAIRPPRELEPGASLEIPIPLGELYPLESGKSYTVQGEYGQDEKVAARATVRAP